MAALERFRLDGQVALVTGATGGLGSAMCRALAEAGAHVALAELPDRLDGAMTLARELEREHRVRAAAVPIDVTDVRGIELGVAEAEAALGPLDVTVANAGIAIRKPSLELTEEDWDKVLDVDLKGVFFTCKAAGRGMVARGRGSIVCISSQNGVVGMEERAAYCAAKAGVVNLVRVLALEWAGNGVRVNAVGPTFVRTALTQRPLDDPATREGILRRIPLGRLGTAEEVANAVLFLASPAASLVTGACLLADGGWTAA
ncbi:MAG TPA: SDR family oxidoreductase [Chloroflexota bacterium]|nr:SDR family oxidoreductase [Chloroflexota bacterium]